MLSGFTAGCEFVARGRSVLRRSCWANGPTSYQAPKSLTLRLVVIVMAGGGPPSTSLLIMAGKDVDADLRRHDDFAATRGSS